MSKPLKTRGVLKAAENKKALETTTWLGYDIDPSDHAHVIVLMCCICIQFRDRLVGGRNYSAAHVCVEVSMNLRTSGFKDHICSDMHLRAMLLLKKQVGTI